MDLPDKPEPNRPISAPGHMSRPMSAIHPAFAFAPPHPISASEPAPIVFGQRPKVRGQGREALVVSRTLGDFDHTKSPAWPELMALFGGKIKINELKSLATAIQTVFARDLPKLGRTTTRRMPLIVKWFDENWWFCSQVLPYFKFVDESDNPAQFY
jgi:hypothetical protein